MFKESKKRKVKDDIKTKYKSLDIENKLDSIKGWINHGIEIKKLCKMLGINQKDFKNFQKKFPTFREATKGTGKLTDGLLLNTAFNLAIGFYAEEEEIIKVKDIKIIDGKAFNIERAEIVKVKKYIAPNTTINMFMIKSRLKAYSENKDEDQLQEIKITLDEALEQWAR